jgi:hypothetical protein
MPDSNRRFRELQSHALTSRLMLLPKDLVPCQRVPQIFALIQKIPWHLRIPSKIRRNFKRNFGQFQNFLTGFHAKNSLKK